MKTSIENKIIIKEIQASDYLTASKLPTSDYVINPYVGCPHGCVYCYASFMKRFTNHQEDWGTFLDIKRCNKKINTKKLVGKTIFLSSVTDCYNPYEEKYKLTRKIIEQLTDVDCKINISTKNKLILRDIDLLKQMKNVEVSISINTLDESFKNDMDYASSIEERIETLKVLHDNNIKTVLFMSPIFPEITEWQNIIIKTKDFVDFYWFENLNLRAGYKQTIMNYIKEKYPQHLPLYNEIYKKGNKDYWEELAIQINNFCLKNKIKFINYFYHEKIKKK